MARAKKKNGNGVSRARKPFWVRMSNEELLGVRMCDLKLRIEGSPVEARTRRILDELRCRDIRLVPYFYFSDDWFTPAGLTGIAVPFYLAHPRLMQLERAMVGEVEGQTERWCMKLLRHEVGHAVDHAWELHKKRRWCRLFGPSSHRYPRYYRPNPFSKRHVQHLEYWYAQSHPDEDFAETFAVWLRPRSNWRARYKGWPALKKLEYVDELMSEISGTSPFHRTRARIDSVPTLRKTLAEHYEQRRRNSEATYPGYYDRDLKRLFLRERGRGAVAASSALKRVRPEVVRLVSPWTGENPYLVDQVIMDIIGRARELKLYSRGPEKRLVADFSILLTKHLMHSVYKNRRWVGM